MKLLALDTSTDACSVALCINDEVQVDHRIAPQKHAQLLLPMIDRMLSDAGLKATDLDGIAFGCGPGSFTGVRIAAATTQGIAFGADIGVIPISSLQALAQGASRTHQATHTIACIDARMSEVYWGAYVIDEAGYAQTHIPDSMCPPADLVLPSDDKKQMWSLLGTGADEYIDEIKTSIASKGLTFEELVQHVPDAWPNAQDVLRVASPLVLTGNLKSADEALPIYLRNRVALTEAQRAKGERL